ncbi:hypothetical protein D3C80_1594750 [compost metagenome]
MDYLLSDTLNNHSTATDPIARLLGFNARSLGVESDLHSCFGDPLHGFQGLLRFPKLLPDTTLSLSGYQRKLRSISSQL